MATINLLPQNIKFSYHHSGLSCSGQPRLDCGPRGMGLRENQMSPYIPLLGWCWGKQDSTWEAEDDDDVSKSNYLN